VIRPLPSSDTNAVARFRKIPVEVEAFRYGVHEPPIWFADAESKGTVKVKPDSAVIDTLEGKMRAEKGDWVVRGVKGELYPWMGKRGRSLFLTPSAGAKD
jgi:hypothetical protein